MPPRRRRPAAPHRNEAARLADQLQRAGYTKRDIARIINRDASLVSQFYTKNKGAAFVPALTQVLIAVHTAGISDVTELAAIAAPTPPAAPPPEVPEPASALKPSSSPQPAPAPDEPGHKPSPPAPPGSAR